MIPAARRTVDARPSAPTTSPASTSATESPIEYVTRGEGPASTWTSDTPRTTVAPAASASSMSAWQAIGWRRFRVPATPGTMVDIGSSRRSVPSASKDFHTGAMWAPAARSTGSTPSSFASPTPQACMLSPRTRSA